MKTSKHKIHTFWLLILFNLSAFNSLAQSPNTNSEKSPLSLVISSVSVSPVSPCYGGSNGSITVNASGGQLPYLYSNNNGATFQSSNVFSGLTADGYFVVVKDDFGAVASQYVEVSQPVRILITGQTHSNVSGCYGDTNGSITLTASGGTGTLSYIINNGTPISNTTGNFTNLGGGTYTVAVQDAAACSVSGAPVIVTQPALLELISQTANPVVGCYGDATGSIHITASGGTLPLRYSITGGAPYQTEGYFSGLSAGGPHQVFVIDNNGCSVTGNELYITQPDLLQITSESHTDVTTCNGGNNGTITITASGGTGIINYSADGGNSYLETGLFSDLIQGTYPVQVRDAASCLAIGSTITINQPSPVIITNVTTTDITGCFGDNNGNIIITASGGTGSMNYSITGGDSYQASNTFNALFAGGYQVTVQDANHCTTNGNFYILNQPSKVVATKASSTNVFECHDSADGTITVVAYGGIAPLSYWLNGINYGTYYLIENLAAGTYNVLVKDANGCSAVPPENVLTLTAPEPIVITEVTSSNPNCFGNTNGLIEITATGGTGTLYFSVDNGITFIDNNTVTGLSANIPYTVQVKDDHQCTVIGGTYTLTQPSEIIISQSFQDVSSCAGGNNGSIEISATGGVSPYFYSINGGATSSTSGIFTGLSAGNYWTWVKDTNNCTKIGSMITISDPEAFILSNVSHTNIQACNGANTGTITISHTGGTLPITYSIGNGIPDQIDNGNFINLPAGTYTPYIIDSNSCDDYGQITTITQPTVMEIAIDFSSPEVTCFNDEDGQIIFHGNGGQLPYSYSINGTNFYVTNSFSNLSPGSYFPTIRDAYNCSISAGEIIISEPTQVIIDSVRPTNITSCNGASDGSISIFAQGGTGILNYSVNMGDNYSTNSFFNNLQAGDYLIRVQDQRSCTAIFPETITLTEPSTVTLGTITSSDISCHGDANGEIHFTANGGIPPYTYSINNIDYFDNGGNFLNLSGGLYTIKAQDSNHCKSQTDQQVVNEPDSLYIFQINTEDENCVNSNDGLITVVMQGGTQPCTYSLDNIVFQPFNTFGNLAPGDYTVYAHDAHGCTSTSEPITISSQQSTALFTNDVSEGCPPLAVQFTKTSPGITYRWNFGDGQSVALASPLHIFENTSSVAVNYLVTSYAYSTTGCYDTARTVITVYPRPQINFTVTPEVLTYPDTIAHFENTSGSDLINFYWNFGDGTSSTASNPLTHNYPECGTYVISLAGYNGQCRDTSETEIYVNPRPLVSLFNINTLSGCTPVIVNFNNITLNDTYSEWTLGDGSISTSDSITKIYDTPGIYPINLHSYGDCGTEDSISTQIEVFASPKIAFRADPDSIMPPEQPIHCYNYSETGSDFFWNFGDGTFSHETEPLHYYSDVEGYFNITLTVTSANGCVDSLILSDSVYVMPIGFVKFPDAFTPNDDGLNDVFLPAAFKSVKKFNLKIYNAWGNLVFVSNSPNEGWDGKYNNKQADTGVYFWILKGNYENGKPFTGSGNLTLLLNKK